MSIVSLLTDFGIEGADVDAMRDALINFAKPTSTKALSSLSVIKELGDCQLATAMLNSKIPCRRGQFRIS